MSTSLVPGVQILEEYVQRRLFYPSSRTSAGEGPATTLKSTFVHCFLFDFEVLSSSLLVKPTLVVHTHLGIWCILLSVYTSGERSHAWWRIIHHQHTIDIFYLKKRGRRSSSHPHSHVKGMKVLHRVYHNKLMFEFTRCRQLIHVEGSSLVTTHPSQD